MTGVDLELTKDTPEHEQIGVWPDIRALSAAMLGPGESRMRFSLRLLIVTLIAVSQHGTAQSPSKATISEPGIYQLADLFTRADKVALVKVTSGNAEAYDVAIYKARVVEGFKGLTAGETIYFGPYIRTELGAEYILFLRDNAKAIEPKTQADSGYGTVKYSEVFDEGYSSMLTSYECVFNGASPNQDCDYGVRVCTDYIKLPNSLPSFPADGDNTPFGCRWVRKAAFISFLDSLGGKIR